MSIAEKLTIIAENEQKVYNAGYEKGKAEGGGDTEAAFEEGRQAERVEQWNNFTNNGKRTDFSYAFFGWGNEYITPTKKITPTNVNSGNQTFSGCPNLKKVEKKYFDFQNKPRGANNNQGWLFTFSSCPNLTIIEDIGMQADFIYSNTFAYNQKLKTIEVIRTDEDTKWSSGCFNNCTDLESVTIAGTIGQNGFDIHFSTKLKKASMLSILKACNKENAGVTITLPSVCPDLNAEVGVESDVALSTVLVNGADPELTDAWTATVGNYTFAYL